MNQQMKPCPFCGGESVYPIFYGGWWYVSCGTNSSNGCGASTAHFRDEDEESARASWNLRHPSR